ncbi:astakine-like isoform X2 [Portunus trituberculatus]|uniref:astakine-like isoform X2 n=1 Tax=Portunus trituberculatus TaxID=210409 RepID=UPI001E1CDAD5|nr:astakine-like isoform X2 [Portunus trituberculatus]
MSGRRVLLLAVAVAVVVTVVTASTKASFAECTHNDDCGPLSCCLLGRMRYSIPSCAPLGTVGSYCYSNSQPSSHGLHYPGDVYLELEAAHLGMCPCEPGLVCYRGMCQLEHEVPSQSH